MSENKKSKKRKLYDDEVMKKAIEEVKAGMPINTASKKYAVPRSSLHSKVVNKYNKSKTGPDTVLSEAEESALVKWIIHSGAFGNPVSKDELLNSVAVIIKKSPRPHPFTDGRPGRHWYEGFLRRHPIINTKISENVNLSGAELIEEYVKE